MKTLVFLRNPLVPGFWPRIGRVGILRRVMKSLGRKGVEKTDLAAEKTGACQ
jgi:hypothetical protein